MMLDDVANVSSHLCQEGIVGDMSEEVPLAHVLRGDLGSELLQEDLQGLSLVLRVPEVTQLGTSYHYNRRSKSVHQYKQQYTNASTSPLPQAP